MDDGHVASIYWQYKNVKKNAMSLVDQSIAVLKFVGCHELFLRGHDVRAGREVFLDMVQYTASLNTILRDQLDGAAISKGVSKVVMTSNLIF